MNPFQNLTPPIGDPAPPAMPTPRLSFSSDTVPVPMSVNQAEDERRQEIAKALGSPNAQPSFNEAPAYVLEGSDEGSSETSVDPVDNSEPFLGDVGHGTDDAGDTNETSTVATPIAPLVMDVNEQSRTPGTAPAQVKATQEAGLIGATPANLDAMSVEELDRLAQEASARRQAKLNAEKQAVLAQIVTVCSTYAITTDEVVEALGGYKPKRAGVKAPIKFRGPNGEQWSGRGRKPMWMGDRDPSEFKIVS